MQYTWNTHVTDKRERASQSISICEEALYKFEVSDDSLAGVLRRHDISVRDFMLLSLVADQGCFEIEQLARALGLEKDAVKRCVRRLSAAALLGPDLEAPAGDVDSRVCASNMGKALARRILLTISGGDE
jgi:hypothetical protein